MVQSNGSHIGTSRVDDRATLQWHLPPHLDRIFVGTAPPYYIAGTRSWVWHLCLVMALGMTAVAVVFVALRALEDKMSVAEWVLGFICLPFMIVLAQPKTWVPPVWMIADMNGFYFLGGSVDQGYTFVPWHEVSEMMSIERIATGSGVRMGIVILIEGESAFWKSATESRFMSQLLQPVQADGYRRLPLTGLGQNLKRSLAALSYLRQHSPSVLRDQR